MESKVDLSSDIKLNALSPGEIVAELDKYVIGQSDAKRAVAIALRNRWRRLQVEQNMREEIHPKNIIMIGPTGVGKTAIARRLAKLACAPFLKVEATKFTEVGYIGRDVESIIRDLMEVAVTLVSTEQRNLVQKKAKESARQRVVEIIQHMSTSSDDLSCEHTATKLAAGDFDTVDIEVEATESIVPVMENFGPGGMEEMVVHISDMFGQHQGPKRKKTRKMSVKKALSYFEEEESSKLIDRDSVVVEAVRRTEQCGIVFIDEIDKVAARSGSAVSQVSREGVQRDLLPVVEGTSVNTKYGSIKTDHILFVASGAFSASKPADMIPELQGRFPIRVELSPLRKEDLIRILVEPDNALIRQYESLMATEDITLKFTPDAITQIAQTAQSVNDNNENIGARRLHTVMERLLDELSFDASDMPKQTIEITSAYVKARLDKISKNEDLAQYIL